MALDMKLLAGKGVSSAAYKKIFTQDNAKLTGKQKRLVNQISGRMRDGKEMNLKEWRAFYAVDLACDVPFSQTTPTIVGHLLSKKLSAEDTLEELGAWGLSKEDMFMEIPGADGKTSLSLNIPVFFNIFIPVVKAYTAIRLANLFNARNSNPLLEYKPLKETESDQVLCDIVTDIVEEMSRGYGYPAVLRQGIQQMLKYGVMLMFPREEWHCERQLEVGEDGIEKKVTIKEGIRYICPHPTRMYYDLKYPLTALNTDSGPQFVGHWHVLSYGDILDNPMYWNRRHIFSGTNWFLSPFAGNYFREVFPCAMKFPCSSYEAPQREDRAAWYSSAERDQAVFVGEHFEKIVPKDWDLGDYRYPVWHRFTMAGDDTVIWAEPMAYCPAWFMGYDYDENAGRNSGFSLECLPWQDTLGGVLSQMILTAKQNLSNVVFYDTNMINTDDISKLKNLGEQRYRSVQWMPFDSIKTRVQGLQPQAAFQQPRFDKVPIQELLQLIPAILNIMERVLQISAQEVGGQGTHQQSKFELQQVGGASTNRLTFTLAAVDEGLDAWKQQVFDGAIAYLDPDFEAQVSADIPEVETLLEKLGFTLKHKGKEKLLVIGTKRKLKLVQFARSNEGADMVPDKEAAQVLFSTIGTIAGQEDLHKAIGADRLLVLIEFGARLAGAPRGFRLRVKPGGPKDEVPPSTIEAIQAAQQATMKAIEEKIAQPVAQEIHKDQQEIQQLQATVEQLKKIYEIAAKTQDANAIKAKEVEQKMQISQAEFQSSEQRKNAALAGDEKRKQEKHDLEMRQSEESHVLRSAVQGHQHHVSAAVKLHQSEIDSQVKKEAAEAKKSLAQASKKPKPET